MCESISMNTSLSIGARLLFIILFDLQKERRGSEICINNTDLSKIMNVHPMVTRKCRNELIDAGMLEMRRKVQRGINITFLKLKDPAAIKEINDAIQK